MYRSGNGFRNIQTYLIESIDRHSVKAIFVDETMIRIDGQDYYWLLIAYEPNLRSYLMKMHLSRERTIFVCYQFFLQLPNRYGNKPILTDGARWYNDDACK
ncbi:MAG: hypothetical protein WCF03_12050 [Nitrososphaeraceae archaeon]